MHYMASCCEVDDGTQGSRQFLNLSGSSMYVSSADINSLIIYKTAIQQRKHRVNYFCKKEKSDIMMICFSHWGIWDSFVDAAGVAFEI